MRHNTACLNGVLSASVLLLYRADWVRHVRAVYADRERELALALEVCNGIVWACLDLGHVIWQ